MVRPTLYYSIEEENWIQGQLQKFDECWKKVPMGEEILSNFIMYNYDVPLSKSFVPRCMANLTERYRLIMKSHTEFTEMSQYHQERLWKRNIFLGTAWALTKLESCKTGQEQWEFNNDGTHEMSDAGIGPIMVKNKMKRVNMDIANSFSGLFSASEMDTYRRLTKDISELIYDEETFRLFTLVLLFSDMDISPAPGLAQLRNTYLNIIRRRLGHMDFGDVASDVDYNNLAVGNMVYSRFNSCIAGIKELTIFVQKLLNAVKPIMYEVEELPEGYTAIKDLDTTSTLECH